MNEVKKAIEGRLAAEPWNDAAKKAIAEHAAHAMEQAVALAADRGKLPLNGELPPIMHVVTNELITNIVDRPEEATHLVPGIARRIGTMTSKLEAESPHHAKTTRRGESGATRA